MKDSCDRITSDFTDQRSLTCQRCG